MTWRLVNAGHVVGRGTYAEMLLRAEDCRVLERAWHSDGTEMAPRWTERGWSLLPEAVRVRRAA